MMYNSSNFDVGHERLGASILKRQLFCGLLIALYLRGGGVEEEEEVEEGGDGRRGRGGGGRWGEWRRRWWRRRRNLDVACQFIV